MDSMRNRAKEIFPMVLLTLLSIVQALALEFLWDHTRQRADLFELSVAVIPGWLQIAATLNVIVIIWLMYAGMLMRFRWTPTTMDSIFPFVIGLIQGGYPCGRFNCENALCNQRCSDFLGQRIQ